MISKDLKKLSRRDLIDIIYQMKKNEQQMEEEIVSLKSELEEKRLCISNAGSLAEASANISGLFASAQKTADIYLEEIGAMRSEIEMECENRVRETDRIIEKKLSDGKKQYKALMTRYQSDYELWQELRAEIDKIRR